MLLERERETSGVSIDRHAFDTHELYYACIYFVILESLCEKNLERLYTLKIKLHDEIEISLGLVKMQI